MAGLLDLFGGDEPQTQGLLAAAAGILNASGPSLMPRSLGQVLGAGLNGYNEAQQQALARQAAQQNLKLNNFKLQDAESDFKNQELTRQRAQDLLKASADYWQGGGAQAQPMPAPQTAAQMMGGLMSGQAQPLQEQTSQAPQGGRNGTAYQQRMAYAQYLRSKGFAAEAQAEEDSALKLQPKVKEWSKVTVGNKVLYAPYFEDGTSGAPVPLEVAEKLEKVNTGGSTALVNPYTGSTVRSMVNTVDPNTVYSGNITMRGQNMTDARTREQNAVANRANEIKLQERTDNANLAKSGQIASFDTMLGTLERLKTHPGLTRSVGLYSKVPTIPGSDSANFQAELETFKSQAFIPMVSQLKGMGALSDAEGKKLTAAVGALDPRMSEEAFKSSIDRVVSDMDAARARVARTAKGAESAPNQPAQKVRKYNPATGKIE